MLMLEFLHGGCVGAVNLGYPWCADSKCHQKLTSRLGCGPVYSRAQHAQSLWFNPWYWQKKQNQNKMVKLSLVLGPTLLSRSQDTNISYIYCCVTLLRTQPLTIPMTSATGVGRLERLGEVLCLGSPKVNLRVLLEVMGRILSRLLQVTGRIQTVLLKVWWPCSLWAVASGQLLAPQGCLCTLSRARSPF